MKKIVILIMTMAVSCLSSTFIMDVDVKFDKDTSKYLFIENNKSVTGEVIGYFKDTSVKSWSNKVHNGKVIFTKYYYDNGNLQSERDEQSNTFIEYYDTGEIKSESKFKKGFMLDGIYKHYSKEGKLDFEITGDTVIFDGDFRIDKDIVLKFYNETGLISALVKKKEDKIYFYEEYFEDGKLSAKEYYDKEGKITKREEFFEEGALSWLSLYEQGKMVQKKQYYKGGKIAAEVQLKNDKAVSGYNYTYEGKKTKMTNAHFHNLGLEY